MRGQASALEPLRTSRRGHQRRTTRVSLARIVQQRRAHEPAHGPLDSGARHSRDLRGGPRDRGYLLCPFMCCVEPSRMLSSDMIQRVCEGSTTRGAASTMNELTPRGHLRPLGGRENPRRARPESRSPRRCAYAWRRCLLFAGRPEGIDQGTHDRRARAGPLPQLHMRKGVNRNPSRRPELADSDSNLHAVKMTQNWALLTPPLSRAAGPSHHCAVLRNAIYKIVLYTKYGCIK